MKFDRDFYLKDTAEIAKQLLGATLYSNSDDEITGGKIVEVEIYQGIEDKASHAFGGRRTERTKVMYHRGGVAYIYFIYGMYSLFNVVTGSEGIPNAILIRALEPVTGIGLMKRRRNTDKILNLTSGPGKLCRALNITKTQNGSDLTGNSIWIEQPGKIVHEDQIVRAKRIGIDYAEEYRDKLWRFYIKNNEYVSKKKAPIIPPKAE